MLQSWICWNAGSWSKSKTHNRNGSPGAKVSLWEREGTSPWEQDCWPGAGKPWEHQQPPLCLLACVQQQAQGSSPPLRLLRLWLLHQQSSPWLRSHCCIYLPKTTAFFNFLKIVLCFSYYHLSLFYPLPPPLIHSSYNTPSIIVRLCPWVLTSPFFFFAGRVVEGSSKKKKTKVFFFFCLSGYGPT